MIRPKRAMAIDVATLRHVFERIDKNGDGEIDPAEFLEAWSDDPEVAELLTVGSDIACSTDSIDAAEKLRRAQNIFDKIDADQSTRVTFGEFKKYFELRAKMPANAGNAPKQATPLSLDAPLEFMIETLKQVFDMIDKDRDGEISMVELSQAWMYENIGDRLRKTWLAQHKKASASDLERMILRKHFPSNRSRSKRNCQDHVLRVCSILRERNAPGNRARRKEGSNHSSGRGASF